MENQKIKAIELGWGDTNPYFSTELKKDSPKYVDKIVELTRTIGVRVELVYVGFRDDKIVFQMFGGNNITLYY